MHSSKALYEIKGIIVTIYGSATYKANVGFVTGDGCQNFKHDLQDLVEAVLGPYD